MPPLGENLCEGGPDLPSTIDINLRLETQNSIDRAPIDLGSSCQTWPSDELNIQQENPMHYILLPPLTLLQRTCNFEFCNGSHFLLPLQPHTDNVLG